MGRQERLLAAGRIRAVELARPAHGRHDEVDAAEDRTNDYGTFYRVEGVLEGPTGSLSVVCIMYQSCVSPFSRAVPRMVGTVRPWWVVSTRSVCKSQTQTSQCDNDSECTGKSTASDFPSGSGRSLLAG